MRLFTRLLRYMMVFAALGAALGAALMFWLAANKLFHAIAFGATSTRMKSDSLSDSMTTLVMGATDALLFGVVLIAFSYAIMFGFVVETPGQGNVSSTTWKWVKGVAELKHTLIEVILVYMSVDFATDLVEQTAPLSWQTLVIPVAIVLIACALWLLAIGGRIGSNDLPAR